MIEKLAKGGEICHKHPLDAAGCGGEGAFMQKIHGFALAAAAALFASACDTEPEVVTFNRYDPMAEALKNAGPVEAPPMIQESRVYRCRDNSLVYIDFYTNNSAAVRTQRGQPPVATLTAEGGSPPYTGGGYSVSANAAEIRYTSPERGTQTCRS